MSWYSMRQDTKQHIKELYREKAQINLATEAQETSADVAPTLQPSHLLHSLIHFVQSLATVRRRQRISQPPVSLNNA